MASRHSPPSSLGFVLSKSQALRDPTRVDRETWRQVVGTRVSERSRPERLIDGELRVRVASPVWSQELTFLSDTIVRRLRAKAVKVNRLRFFVGTVEAADEPARRIGVAHRAELGQALSDRLSRIEDLELRRAIEDAAAYGLGRQAPTSAPRPRAPRPVAKETSLPARNDRSRRGGR